MPLLFGNVLKLSPRVLGITKKRVLSWIYHTPCIIARNEANLEVVLVFCFCVLYISLGIFFLPSAF